MKKTGRVVEKIDMVVEELDARKSSSSSSRFKRIGVFCGSSPGKKIAYQQAAIDLAKELVERRIDLVYGGGSLGLMGVLSQAVHDGGRHVIGVVPKSLMELIFTTEPVGEVVTVNYLHERKALMAREADAFIGLPGGYGTLEELLEVISGAQLNIHRKPFYMSRYGMIGDMALRQDLDGCLVTAEKVGQRKVGLLNVDGFFNSLLSLIDKAVDEGFISPIARRIVVSAPTPKQLLTLLEEHEPAIDKEAAGLVWECK